MQITNVLQTVALCALFWVLVFALIFVPLVRVVAIGGAALLLGGCVGLWLWDAFRMWRARRAWRQLNSGKWRTS